MAVLQWDQQGEKVYQLGISKGVLYLKDGRVAVWNGLTAMDESSDSELTSYYLDGAKHLQVLSPGDFSGKLKAWTYPDELDELIGIKQADPGLFFHEQPPQSFNLSYQTRVANDLDPDQGYKIHLLYNLFAVPDEAAFETISDEIEPVEFSWSLTGTPPLITGFRPTVHVVVDSTKASSGALAALEVILYGTVSVTARMPTISEVQALF